MGGPGPVLFAPVSFLNQLKSQARALQDQQQQVQTRAQSQSQHTEAACRRALAYLQDLAHQLNVLEPDGPAMSLDGKTPWPRMKLIDFRVDARHQSVQGREGFERIAMGWRIVPRSGMPVRGSVRVNFPPDLERVQDRLAMGPVRHERLDIRSPETNKLLAYEFQYDTETRGNVMLTPDHERGLVHFRVMNGEGFGILHASHASEQVDQALLDELARLLVGQPNSFH